jgi:hypothetical protein
MVSDSRFNMWRAVVAVAHADSHVDPAEQDFVNKYLATVPFTDAQKATLNEDLQTPQDVDAMFDKIAEKVDQSDFFEFARGLLWSDGDYEQQEERLFEHLNSTQMFRVSPEAMRKIMQDTRESETLKRVAEDEEFRKEAKESLRLRNMLKVFGKKRKVL